MNKHFFYLIIFLCVSTHIVIGQNTNFATKIGKVPDDYLCITGTVADIHPFIQSHLMWPSKDRISKHKKDLNDNNVQRAVASTYDWLKKVFRPEWVPENLSNIEVLALKADVVGDKDTDGQGHDVIRFRYKVNNYVIEIASTFSRLTLVIQDDSQKSLDLDEEGAKHFVANTMDLFLREADGVKNISLQNIKKGKSGYKGSPDVKPPTCNIWWGCVFWWTDGHTVMFSMLKSDNRPLVPMPKKDWFSKENKQ